MGAFADTLTRFGQSAMTKVDQVTAGTVIEAGERAVELSPVGDPTLWKRAPPADYRPGDFRGNWFYSFERPNTEVRHNGIGTTTVNTLDALPAKAGGYKHYTQNNLSYGPALDHGHSTQAPAGITAIINVELPEIAYRQARALG